MNWQMRKGKLEMEMEIDGRATVAGFAIGLPPAAPLSAFRSGLGREGWRRAVTLISTCVWAAHQLC